MAAYFSNSFFAFLKELEKNNHRDWFLANRARYDEHVKKPVLAFLADLAGKIEDGYEVSPKSMLRQNRDTRFSKDKSPYKTNVSCFMHASSVNKSDHPHGYYLHLGNDESFFGAGVHSPPPANLLKIRTRIAEDPKAWAKAAKLNLNRGDSLKRPPKGFDPNHPFIEDIKRRNFLVCEEFTKKEVTSPDFLKIYLNRCRASRPLMKFLSEELG